jgi:hypothetical protein
MVDLTIEIAICEVDDGLDWINVAHGSEGIGNS